MLTANHSHLARDTSPAFPLTAEGELAAFLGVSIGTKYYSESRISAYLAWADLNTTRFAFLIGDEVHQFTSALLNAVSLEDALKGALLRGDQFERQIKEIMKARGVCHEIIRWRHVREAPEYANWLSAIYRDYENNPDFRGMVRDQVWSSLSSQLAERGYTYPGTVDELSSADEFVLHEVAGLIVASEYMGYPLEVYPGPDLTVLEAIYSGAVPALCELLPASPKRQFLNLRLN